MKKHKRYRGQLKSDKDREYDSMEKSTAGRDDFRRPAYATKHAVRLTPAEYIARKYGIGGNLDGKEKRTEKSGEVNS